MTVLAEGYPLMGVFWSMLVFFFWILWFWLLITVYSDLFRRRDVGGLAKTGWVVLTLFVPYIGVLIYLIAQGRGMAERRVEEAQMQRAATDEYVRSVVASSPANGHNGAEQLTQARALLDSGAITPEEFEQLKRKVLA